MIYRNYRTVAHWRPKCQVVTAAEHITRTKLPARGPFCIVDDGRSGDRETVEVVVAGSSLRAITPFPFIDAGERTSHTRLSDGIMPRPASETDSHTAGP